MRGGGDGGGVRVQVTVIHIFKPSTDLGATVLVSYNRGASVWCLVPDRVLCRVRVLRTLKSYFELHY